MAQQYGMASRFQGDEVAAALFYALAALVGPSVASWLSATAAQLGASAFSPDRALPAAAWTDGGTLLLKLLGLLAAGAGLVVLVTAALRRRFLGPAKLAASSNPLGTAGSLLMWVIFGGLLLSSWLNLTAPATDQTAAALASLMRALLGTAAGAAAVRSVLQAGTWAASSASTRS